MSFLSVVNDLQRASEKAKRTKIRKNEKAWKNSDFEDKSLLLIRSSPPEEGIRW